ncbi:MAG: alginate O-acetyltransferase AlgX-related protein [Chthoniobacterales bacterium]
MPSSKLPSGGLSVGESYAQGWSRTIVARPVAIGLSVLFSVGLIVVPIVDGLLGSWHEPAQKAREGISKVIGLLTKQGANASSLVDANNAALGAIKSFETTLEDSSALADMIRPSALDSLLRIGGAGSEEAYIGRDGWIFYRPDVDAVVMDSANSNEAARGIVDFAEQLAGRGIRLIVVPVPGKATIHPEKLSAGSAAFANPVAPPVARDLARQVGEAWKQKKLKDDTLAPIVIDATSQIWQRKLETGEEQFLQTDSHWTPEAMATIADSVEKEILASGITVDREELVVEEKEVSSVGDTALMLELPTSSPLRKSQSVTIDQIKTRDGNPWLANPASPVLVLGDSYSNIYSADGLGWGGNAGFSEQLSLRLSHRVDKLARNDAGAKSARQMLLAEVAKSPGWLDGKKLAVWVMAAREFVRGDWSAVALPETETPAKSADFLVVPPGQSVDLTARVLGVGAMPVPGDSPYADYLTALHLGELEDAGSGRGVSGEALAYIFTMRDRKLLPMPGLAQGQRAKLRLSNYAERADKLESLNRGDLADFGVMMEEPNFAEWIDPQ